MGTRAVIMGGGLAGMLAAAAVRPHVDEVVVVERDELPAKPSIRKGVPQARHAHLLMAGGARVMESLVPGVLERLFAAGAHRIAIPSNLVTMSATGWMRRGPEAQFMITCSRALLDWVVREQVRAGGGIGVVSRTSVEGLLGTASCVTGVRTRDVTTGEGSEVTAALVIDASGRATKTPQWLEDLGVGAVEKEIVDSGLAYATRIFRAPASAATGFPLVNVQANPRLPQPGRTATLMPIEDGQWLVTLSGTRGGEPPTTEDEFIEFARTQVRHPVVGDLLVQAQAQPLTKVFGSHSTANQRHRYENLPTWPQGFVALGDAVATYNPVYGHGMSVAAHGAFVLGRVLAEQGFGAGSAAYTQRLIGRIVDGPWLMATGEDLLYPEVRGAQPTKATSWRRVFVDRMARTAASRPRVAGALLGAFTLSQPMSTLSAPAILFDIARGPNLPPLAEPPLTASEWDRVRQA